jgi:hypothetical protein
MPVQKPSKHGRDHVYGAEDPIPSLAMWPIKVFRDDIPVTTGDGKFIWLIPEDLDGHTLMKVEAANTTTGTGATTIQIRKVGVGDMLTTPITIDSGEKNSKDAGTQSVVSTAAIATVAWGDHIAFDFDAAGAGALGTLVYCYFLAGPDAVQAVMGAQGPVGNTGPQGPVGPDGPQGDPGGITAWEGGWVTATAYSEGDAVSHNGSSYVARQDHTSGATSEPGVGASWETYWMLLVESSAVAADGWVDDTATTWTYASASTFTVSGDVTATFTKGTRIKLTQTGVKYFVVVGSSFGGGNTTVTITGGTDYTLANAAISANYYSYAVNPQGYPGWFDYTPTLKATSSDPTLGSGSSSAGSFSVVGATTFVRVGFVFGSSGASAGSGDYYIDAPVGTIHASSQRFVGSCFAYDSGVSGKIGVADLDAATERCYFWIDSTTARVSNTIPQTWANNDQLHIEFSYRNT